MDFMTIMVVVLGILCVLLIAAVVVVGVICKRIFFQRGAEHRKQVAEAEIGSAEEEAKRIVEDAVKEAATKKKEALLEAQEEIHRQRSEADKELKDRRSELSRQERRMVQKEENLDRKADNLEKKEEKLNDRLKQAEKKLEEAEQLRQSEIQTLERISQLTVEEAKTQLLSSLEDDLAYEKGIRQVIDHSHHLADHRRDRQSSHRLRNRHSLKELFFRYFFLHGFLCAFFPFLFLSQNLTASSIQPSAFVPIPRPKPWRRS